MTAGLVAHSLSKIPGASNYLRGGIVCYDSRVKVEQVGVPEALIQIHTAVSAEVAEALAVGVRERLHADLGVSVVGFGEDEFAGVKQRFEIGKNLGPSARNRLDELRFSALDGISDGEADR